MLNIASGAITYDECEDIVPNSENDSSSKRRKLAGVTNSITISYSVSRVGRNGRHELTKYAEGHRTLGVERST